MSADAENLSVVESLERDAIYQQKCKDHPIEARLFHRAAEQIDEVRMLLSSYSAGKLSSQSFVFKFNNLWPQFHFTITWLFGDIQEAKIDPPSLQDLLSRGWSDQLATDYLSLRSKRLRGRPVTTRQLAIRALEIREKDPKQSWAKLAIKFSTPKKQYSKDAIRREATRLKEFLKSLD